MQEIYVHMQKKRFHEDKIGKNLQFREKTLQ